MVPKQLEVRNDILFSKLVPDQGKCETVEGEMLRAINRIVYRHYNDGDYWYSGYGCETAGPAAAYLHQHSLVDVHPELRASERYVEDGYRLQLNLIMEKIVKFVEDRVEYTPNYQDMLNCTPIYQDESNDEEEEFEGDDDSW